MAREYKCPVYFEHSMDLVRELQNSCIVDLMTIADRLETALRHDQHDNHHDAEFHDGCSWCAKDREKYG